MKRILLASFIACSSCLLLWTMQGVVPLPPRTAETETEERGENENPLALEQYLQARYADPATGKVPAMALQNAMQELYQRHLLEKPTRINLKAWRTAGWQPVNDNFASLSVTGITYDPQHPQVFYFCTGEGWYNADASIGAGVWKSTDAGATWNQLPATNNANFQYCQKIMVHPASGDIYVGTKTGLRRSQDGGATFKKVLGLSGYSATSDAVADIEFTASGNVFACLGIFDVGGIYYSPNGDSGTWHKQTTGLPASGYQRVELATAPSNDNVAYAVMQSSGSDKVLGIYKTSDKGAHWASINEPGGSVEWAKKQAWYDLTLAVDPHHENVVAAGGWQLWKTSDGGNSWMQLAHARPDSFVHQYVHVDEHTILFDGSDTVYIGNDGGIWRSTDFQSALPDIYDKNDGYRVTQFYSCAVSQVSGSPVIIGGTQDNGSPGMLQNGISPFTILSWADGAFSMVNYNNPDIFYTNKNSNGTYRINDGGASGTRDTITNLWLTDNNVEFINPMLMDPNDPDKLYMGSNIGLWRLKNASTVHLHDSAWRKASASIGTISALGVSKNVPNIVFLGQLNGHVYRVMHADTSGATTAPVYMDPSHQIGNGAVNCIYPDPLDAAHVVVALSNYNINNVYETHNGLDSVPVWTPEDGDLPNLPVNWVFLHPHNDSVCYIGTDLGVFYTTRLQGNATHWLPANNGLPNLRIQMFDYREADHQLFCATHGRGTFQCTLPDGPSYDLQWSERGPRDVGGRTQAIMVDPNDPTHRKIWAGSVSGGLWVSGNIDSVKSVLGVNSTNPAEANDFVVYPNPAGADGSQIRFTAAGGMNQCSIYSATGALVADLLHQYLEAGRVQELHWSPAGNLPSGIYYVVLERAGRTEIRKEVLMK